MEYATRAGALTSRYFGETEELLPKYAWYYKNSQEQTWPVGSLKPNDFGLFDTHGNAWTWCQESFHEYPTEKGEKSSEDQESDLDVNPEIPRMMRGGSFFYIGSSVRSAYRNVSLPTLQDYFLGFRVARTLPSDSVTAVQPTPAGEQK